MLHRFFDLKSENVSKSSTPVTCIRQTLEWMSVLTATITAHGRTPFSLSSFSTGTAKTSRKTYSGYLSQILLMLVLCAGVLLLYGQSSVWAFMRADVNQSSQSVENSSVYPRRRKRGNTKHRKDEAQDKAASYARFSSSLQRDDSIERQQEKCRQKAISNGHSISHDLEYTDKAVSGTKLKREGLDRLLEEASDGKFNVLYLYSLSRLARESVITMPLLKKLVHTYKVRCICVMEGIDTEVTGWEVIASIFSVIHEQFIKDLSESVHDGQELALRQGYSVGDWCFGYGSEPVPGTEQTRSGRNSKPRKVYVINEEHAEWVSKIYTWYVDEGYSIGQIVRMLNQQKAPKDHRSTTDDWHHNLVVGILSNRKYIGIWPWGECQNDRDPETGKLTQEIRPEEESEKWTRERPDLRIVDEHTFRKAQEKLDANSEKWEQHRKAKGRLKGSSSETNGRRKVRLLHGLLKCAKCGNPFYNTGRRFQCRDAKRGICNVITSVQIKDVEKMIVDRIGEIILNDAVWFDYALKETKRCYHEYESRVPAAIREKERALSKVNQKIERLLDIVEEGDPPQDLNSRLQRRNEERKALQEELTELRRECIHDGEAPDAAWLKERLLNLYEDLQKTSPSANHALRSLIDGDIILEEIDIPLRKRKALRGAFCISAHSVSCELKNFAPDRDGSEHTKQISIDFIQSSRTDLQRETAKKMYDAGEPEKNIAVALKVGRTRVTTLLHEAFALLGLKKPDGRQRRWQLDDKHQKTLLHQSVAEKVMERFDRKMTYGKIAKELEIDRNVVTESVKYWHEQRGLPVPDGRSRRKNL
ncbi:recombinase family protein [Gimesia chilikensis]|uniref:Recombinase family protein n=1 Tax=Gimesia chilikensis TaxID=2605989 RepID=A0A517PSS7_9PLAN|nr:recombinase family protein [Gimesia chilikensis]QDT22427.1 hypothetical protein HG66A1_42350 [Gimesia chilikensis]